MRMTISPCEAINTPLQPANSNSGNKMARFVTIYAQKASELCKKHRKPLTYSGCDVQATSRGLARDGPWAQIPGMEVWL